CVRSAMIWSLVAISRLMSARSSATAAKLFSLRVSSLSIRVPRELKPFCICVARVSSVVFLAMRELYAASGIAQIGSRERTDFGCGRSRGLEGEELTDIAAA